MTATSTIVVVTAGVCAAVLAWTAFRPVLSWRLRKVPGPRRLPFVGHIADLLAYDMTTWIGKQTKKYGSVFTMWSGAHPMVIVSDPDLVRRLSMMNTARPGMELFTMLVGQDHEMVHRGLLSLSPDKHGAKFRAMRKAFEQAVLSPQALSGHASMLRDCASRLVTHLSRHAATGEPVDLARALSDMTMDAIGFAAFGLDLDCFNTAGQATGAAHGVAVSKAGGQQGAWYEAPPGCVEFSRGLVSACRMVFKPDESAGTSLWKLPAIFFPDLYDLVRHVSSFCPGRLLRDEQQIRRELRLALQALIAQWKRHHQSSGVAGDNGMTLPAASERGFLSKLMACVGSEEGLGEIDVVAQAFTMTLAGYETTASVLSSCMHLLAQHPEAQARLHQELDEVLQGKTATADDLDRLPYLSAVLDEALRLYPPGKEALRQQKQDLDLGDGRVIPKGAFLWLNIYALHRDPAVWPRALDFLPERHLTTTTSTTTTTTTSTPTTTSSSQQQQQQPQQQQPGSEGLAPSNPQAFLPFGVGARMCVGYKFALLEARLALALVCQAYSLQPAPGCPPPKWKCVITYSPDHVWCVISPRARGGKQQ